LEALRLYRIVLSSGVESDDARFITRSIEKLIALHVVLPARSLFMERDGSGIDYSKDEDPDWSAVQPVTATFKPLFEDHSPVNINCNGTDPGSVDQNSCIFPATWKPAELIPTFYDIVARSVPRDSFRRQNTEASWLETVFVALAELAYSSTQLSDKTVEFIPLLEQLFIVVRARKISLSLHTFLTHASYTGLLKGKEDPQHVRWSLTTLLVELGADIFLPNSGFKDSTRLLNALFQSLHHVRSDMSNQETYQLVKKKAVIPLLRAFAGARDLPTFAGLWYEQLREIEVSRRSRDKVTEKSTYSVWEDDDVLLVYQEALKSTLSDVFLKSQIETAISTVTKSGHISKSPESYAYFVILEAGSHIWGHNGLPGLRIDLVTSFMEALHKSLSKRKGDRHWIWRLWRMARNLMPISLKSTLNTPNELADKFKREALVVANFSTGPTKLRSGWNGHQESFEACRFLLSLSKELHHETSAERRDILHVIINCLTGSFNSIIETKLEGWNGRYQDIDGLAQQATAVIECLLEHPDLLSELSFEDLKCFVKFLWDLTSSSSKDWKQNRIPEITECVSFKQLWRVFLSHEYLTDNPSLASGTARALCELFMEIIENDQTQPAMLRYLPGIVQDLPGIPVRHGEVPKFKDTVEALMTKVDCPAEFVPFMVSLINGWCQESGQVGPEILEWITSDIPLQGSSMDMRTIESFRSLIRTVFECEYKACKSPAETGKILKRFYKLTIARVESCTTQLGLSVKNKDQPSTLTPIFVGTSLRLLSERQGVESKVLNDIARQREKIFGLLLTRFDNCTKTLRRKTHTEAAVLLVTTHQMLEDFDDLAVQQNAELDKSSELGENGSDLNVGIQIIAQRRKIARAATSDGFGFDESTLLQGIGLCRMQACEQTYLAREFTKKLKSMNNADRIKAIHELKIAGFEGSEGASRLLLGGLAVSVLDEIAEKDSTEAREVSSLCTAVTNVLQHGIDEIEQFSLAAECVDIILRLHPRGVTQYNIDSCLTAVTTTMSKIHSTRETNQIPTKSISTIYTRLCRILGTIVGLYRQQLGGRFHLLVPALQSLLKALFASNRKRSQKGGLALGISHTVQFTRLLTSLCDPTVSAVSRPSRPNGNSNNSLIDQTKKAKVIAGQHLRLLIESYAQNMLEAPLQPDIKTALAPGLYAILDAMPVESKRGLNAGMDISSRAIFKTLHEEYVRFGKWNSKG
jgi:nucleolar pre-ribosomal-associated protein 2